MPYKSKAQRKFFHANKKKLEKQGVDVKEWDKESKGLKLPKKVKKKTMVTYISNSKFWFEPFHYWHSEFLSVFSIIFLSIYLREINLPQSKPVAAPHSETGE